VDQKHHHGPLHHIFYPIDKANLIADCLGNQFRGHVEAKVEALLAIINKDTPVNFRPCNVSKEIHSLKLGKACGFDGIPK
jgi:hypothetical protein